MCVDPNVAERAASTKTLPHARPERGVSRSCDVALRVERTVTRAADHRQGTRLESRSLACVGTHRRSQNRCVVALKIGRTVAIALLGRSAMASYVCTSANDTARVVAFKVERSVVYAAGRRHAASIARTYVCADAVVAALETTHVIARDRGPARADARSTRPHKRIRTRDCAPRRTRGAGLHAAAHLDLHTLPTRADVGPSSAPLPPSEIPHAQLAAQAPQWRHT